MKYAIISDIHANLMALEKVLKDAESHGAGKIVCLGDVVGYGPLPVETVERVRNSAETVLAGNHDDAVSGRISEDDFIDLAADAVKRHREALSETDIAWLKSLPYTAEIEGAIIAHGDFTDPPAFNYVMDGDTAEANLRATDAQLMLVGHTHVPGVYLVGKSGRLYLIDPEDFTLEDHKRYIVNPGSVGYPRESKGQCYSSYVLYDSTAHTIQFRLLPFTVSSVMQRGTNPKTVTKRIVIAAVAAAAVISAALAFLLSPAETVYDDNPALVITNVTRLLVASDRSVKAGLKLAKGDPALLRVVFRNAAGEEIASSRFEKSVKLSNNESIAVPEGATSADFTVRRLTAGSSPVIKEFVPDRK